MLNCFKVNNMKNRIVNNQPQEVTDYLIEEPIDQNAIECINEIFKSL